MKILINSIMIFTIFYQTTKANDVADPVFKENEFNHVNPGCPINSQCSKATGKKVLHWEKFLKTIDSKNKTEKLNSYLKKYGVPLTFLAPIEAKIALDPIMWNSSCRIHNPKNPNNNIFKSVKFLKKLVKSDTLHFTPVRVYYEGEHKDFLIPYQDSLVMIDQSELVTLRDYDDFYYHLSIHQSGSLKIKSYSSDAIDLALDKKVAEVECPKTMNFNSTYFAKTYCSKIWDNSAKKLRIIQYGWACP